MNTIESMEGSIKKFCEERDWDQFHNPKDLAIGVSTEAAELLELFRFKTDDETRELLKNKKFRGMVGEELADVLYFILRFAQMYDFDLSDELSRKLECNQKKYPVEKSLGSNKKYTEL